MEIKKTGKETADGKQEGRKEKKRTAMSRPKKILSIVQFAVLLGIVFGIPALIYHFNPEIIENCKSVDKFESWISEYTGLGIVIYIVCQVTQIVLSVLPGQVIQIAGGYIFGFFTTFLISIAGAFIGTVVTFYLAKLLGKNAIMLICGEERFHKYTALMNTDRARKIIFLIYLIPGLPKDVTAYAAGVSNINVVEFTLLSLIGRIPGMTVSILFGVMLYSSNYLSAVLIAAAMFAVVLVCFLKRKAITEFIERKEKVIHEKSARRSQPRQPK